jgi:DNA-packaging protein gp3
MRSSKAAYDTNSRMAKPNGRPPKYSSEQVLVKAVDAYFDGCKEKMLMPSKAGICYALNLSRDTYNEYKKRFPDTLKQVENYIEAAWVQRLAGTAATGAIFYLKNAFKEDYRDRTETDVTSKGEKITGINYISPTNGTHASPDA